jgi:MYXO-CTERM domain-containing protein
MKSTISNSEISQLSFMCNNDAFPMMKTLSILSFSAALSAALLFAPEAKAGGLDACGDIFVEAEANCEVVVDGGCTAQCEPVAFNASCAAEGAIGCRGDCNLDVEATCTASCQTTCETDCNVDPGAFDCRASCEGNCSGQCSSRCSADANSAECQASCESTCSLECGASCEVTPPQADCTAQCEGSCGGKCSAEVNLDCQIDCQSDLYVECKADLQGGCEAQCETPEGALFCDGQFIEVSNIDACANALRDLLNAEVEFHAEAEGSASFSCSVADEPSRGGWGLLGFGAMCLLALGRRRD